MQNTVNLNLKKPDQNDFVNIGDINDNMDILDAEVAKKYVKPLAGIPSLDLDSATQAALKKAETALQTVTKSSVGLGNVDNTSDVNKPVSTAQQVALDKKANIASPILTGTPTAPTAAESTNTQQIATTAFVDRAVKTHQADLVSHGVYGTATGTNTLALPISTVTSYVEGMLVAFKNTTANTGAVTLNINSLGAKPIKKANGNDFSSGNLKAGAIYQVRYDGVNFCLLGEGGEYGTVTANDVRKTKTFGTENGVVQGTLDLSNLIASNIKKGVTIDGVTGTLPNVVTTPGNLYIFSDFTTYSISYKSNQIVASEFTTIKSFAWNGENGSLRIRILLAHSYAEWSYFKIYKNGVAVGIERRPANDSADYSTIGVAYVEDFSVTKGDIIEVRARTGGTAYLKAFSFGVSNNPFGTIL